MNSPGRTALLLLVILFLSLSSTNLMAWQPSNGIPICTATSHQGSPILITDGVGGTFIVWTDYRFESNDIFAQRINSKGSPLWTKNGVAICTEEFKQYNHVLTSDGAGGAIIAWLDQRHGDNMSNIYAQRINSIGSTVWTPDGMEICTEHYFKSYIQIVSDNMGGAIITWEMQRNGESPGDENYDIFAQHVNSSGSTLWVLNGLAICTEDHDQYHPESCSDGAGGVILTWYDGRNGEFDIYAQHVNPSGKFLWGPDGLGVCTANSHQLDPRIAPDNAGGAFITWWDDRNGGNSRVYAQHVNSTGSTLWTPNGILLCSTQGYQSLPKVISDMDGGAIIAWQDLRSAYLGMKIYAQHVNSLGSTLWSQNGIAICTTSYEQNSMAIISDKTGGAIFYWLENRTGKSSGYFAQRINSAGTKLWAPVGISIFSDTKIQTSPSFLVDSSGGAIITWQDKRTGFWDIYAQQLSPEGNFPLNIISNDNVEPKKGVSQ